MRKNCEWKCTSAAACCGLQSEGTVAHIVSSSSSSSLANCFTETLSGSHCQGPDGFGQSELPVFENFSHIVALFSRQKTRSEVSFCDCTYSYIRGCVCVCVS